MARALSLAERGAWTTHPNPRVGCVVVAGDEVVGEGFHARAGAPHAEIEALAAAGARAAGATCYVTLEPCAHHGRTPPCADALIEARIARVLIAGADPNPAVNGQGIARLRAAGIEVEAGLLAGPARELNPGFYSRHERQRPWVRLKLGGSLDGATAMSGGESQWITGPAARADVQRWRARAAAVVTGIGTVLADDPRLDLRLEVDRERACAVLDTGWRLPESARLIGANDRVVWIGGEGDGPPAWAARHPKIRCAPVPLDGDRVALPAALRALADHDLNEIQVEAGATLAGALLAQGLIDELLLYLAPQVLGRNTRGMFAIPALETLDDRVNLRWREVRRIGEDLRIVLQPVE